MFDIFAEKLTQLQRTERFQLEDLLRRQSVAEHSYNVALLVWINTLWIKNEYPDDEEVQNLDLHYCVMLALFHDFPEGTTGDLNYWIKNKSGEVFKAAWDKMERDRMTEFINQTPEFLQDMLRSYLGLKPVGDLEVSLIKTADYLDFTLFCLNELKLGNFAAAELVKIGIEIVKTHMDPRLDRMFSPAHSIIGDIKYKARMYGQR